MLRRCGFAAPPSSSSTAAVAPPVIAFGDRPLAGEGKESVFFLNE
jgi:hypothetical protein